jgi:hypothetical protein
VARMVRSGRISGREGRDSVRRSVPDALRWLGRPGSTSEADRRRLDGRRRWRDRSDAAIGAHGIGLRRFHVRCWLWWLHDLLLTGEPRLDAPIHTGGRGRAVLAAACRDPQGGAHGHGCSDPSPGGGGAVVGVPARGPRQGLRLHVARGPVHRRRADQARHPRPRTGRKALEDVAAIV